MARSNNDSPYKHFIPSVLRDSKEDAAIISDTLVDNMLGHFLDSGMTLQEAVNFGAGCKSFQNLMNDTDSDDIGFFSVQIMGVEEVPIKSNGDTYAHKARIYFWGKDYNSGDWTVQHIDTNFVSFENEWAEVNNIWSVALARTIQKIAEDNVGRIGIFMKLVQSSEDNNGKRIKVRSAINLFARNVKDNDETVDEDEFEDLIEEYVKNSGGSRGGGKQSKSSSRRSRGGDEGDSDSGRSSRRSRRGGGDNESIDDQIKSVSSDLDPDGDFFEKEDFAFVKNLFKGGEEPSNDDILDAIGEHTDLDPVDPGKKGGSGVKFALKALYDTLAE